MSDEKIKGTRKLVVLPGAFVNVLKRRGVSIEDPVPLDAEVVRVSFNHVTGEITIILASAEWPSAVDSVDIEAIQPRVTEAVDAPEASDDEAAIYRIVRRAFIARDRLDDARRGAHMIIEQLDEGGAGKAKVIEELKAAEGEYRRALGINE